MAEQSNEIKNQLLNKLPPGISELEANLLLEQYKLYVQMQDKVSERRHTANSFFLTLNTGLVTAIVAFIGITRHINAQFGWIILSAVAGAALCLTWVRLIQSYRQLNDGKFKIIHLLETSLPANMYRVEWIILGEGSGPEYKPFTRIEILVPIIFAMMYALVGLIIGSFLIWDLFT